MYTKPDKIFENIFLFIIGFLPQKLTLLLKRSYTLNEMRLYM